MTTIGNWAFSGCSNLNYFAFGSKVETIGQEAFSDCINVTKIISRASTPPICGPQALDDISKWTCELTVPQNSIAAYQNADQWKEFFFINGATYDEVTKEGDANSDGITDVSDLALVVNYILGRNPSVFNFNAADVNGDGYIDIADFAGMVNIILRDNYVNMMMAIRHKILENDNYLASIDIPNVNAQAGQTVDIPVSLINSADAVSSLQMDIHLPKGVTIADVSTAEDRRANHQADWVMLNENVARVVYFSPGNTRIKGVNGPIIYLSVHVDETVAEGTYDMSAERIVLTTDGNRMTADAISSAMHVTDVTGIEGTVITDEGDRQFYGIDGTRLNAPRKGITIIRDCNGKTMKISKSR